MSDFLMMSLAKLTVAVGREVKNAVADTEVHSLSLSLSHTHTHTHTHTHCSLASQMFFEYGKNVWLPRLYTLYLCYYWLQYVKSMEVNPHAKEAWKVTKSGVKGTYTTVFVN